MNYKSKQQFKTWIRTFSWLSGTFTFLQNCILELEQCIILHCTIVQSACECKFSLMARHYIGPSEPRAHWAMGQSKFGTKNKNTDGLSKDQLEWLALQGKVYSDGPSIVVQWKVTLRLFRLQTSPHIRLLLEVRYLIKLMKLKPANAKLHLWKNDYEISPRLY